MNKQDITNGLREAKETLLRVLFGYVKEHGERYEDNAEHFEFLFDLNPKENQPVSRVLNFHDNEGCIYVRCMRENKEGRYEEEDFEYNALQCLYITEEIDHSERLRCYFLTADGAEDDPDHLDLAPFYCEADELSIDDLYHICCVVEKTW